MKPLRVLLIALAAIVAAGTIASAAPAFHVPPKGQPAEVAASRSPEPAETESPEPTETESPEPTETESPEPAETESPEVASSSQTGGAAPDFSACVGLRGLDNAICRHEALLLVQPDNPGLANSLAHLQSNAAAHAAKAAAKTAAHGASGQHGNHGGS